MRETRGRRGCRFAVYLAASVADVPSTWNLSGSRRPDGAGLPCTAGTTSASRCRRRVVDSSPGHGLGFICSIALEHRMFGLWSPDDRAGQGSPSAIAMVSKFAHGERSSRVAAKPKCILCILEFMR